MSRVVTDPRRIQYMYSYVVDSKEGLKIGNKVYTSYWIKAERGSYGSAFNPAGAWLGNGSEGEHFQKRGIGQPLENN
jgi:hypothetical protein